MTTCQWPMGGTWSGDRRCRYQAKYRVTSGPMSPDVRFVCGIHEAVLSRYGGGTEIMDGSES
jgi:hypothetical protein